MNQGVWDRAKQCRGAFCSRVPTRAPLFHQEDPSGLQSDQTPCSGSTPKSAQWKDKRAGTTQRCRRAGTLPSLPHPTPGASDPFPGGGTAADAPRRLGPAGPDQEGGQAHRAGRPKPGPGRHPGRPGAGGARAGRAPRPSLGYPRRAGRQARESRAPAGGRAGPAGASGRGPAAQASGQPGAGPAPRGTGGAQAQPGRGPAGGPGRGAPGRTGPQAAPGRRSPRPCPSGRSGPWQRRRLGWLAGWLARSSALGPSAPAPLRPPQEVPGGRPRSASAAPAAATRRPSLKGPRRRGRPGRRLKGAARGPPHPALPAAFRPRPPRRGPAPEGRPAGRCSRRCSGRESRGRQASSRGLTVSQVGWAHTGRGPHCACSGPGWTAARARGAPGAPQRDLQGGRVFP